MSYKTRSILALSLGAFLTSAGTSVVADEPPVYMQIIERLKTDHTVLPWEPQDVQDIYRMSNREAPIPPQCYTDSGGVHNPCYVCHQNERPGRENIMNDRDLQEAYSFSDEGLTNHWSNLFEDRSERVDAISDAEILTYIDQDNYTPLKQRLIDAGYGGWIPDLENLAEGAAAFDSEGFALDGSWWVAFKYAPLPSTFWPTQGSTDDVMIRLGERFYMDAGGAVSRDVYKANLALVEANVKGYDRIGALPFDETRIGTDLNDDGQLTTQVTEVVIKRADGTVVREHYVGLAGTGDETDKDDLIPYVYPKDTEFLHTVRYVGVDGQGNIYNARRMKEVRYMRRRIQSRHFQLHHWYEEEHLDKEDGLLPTYINLGHEGLTKKFGWVVTGFLEDPDGDLRWNTFEENVFCMGCHTSIGSTIDKTFSFPRKPDGAAGWGYIDLRDLPLVPNQGESQSEVATYFSRVGGGTEFRSNPELQSRFYHADGSLNTVAIASARDLYDVLAPSRDRALTLNKAYKAIVEQQDFIFGRDASVTPPPRVLTQVDNETSPTLPPERQFDWNILLDWDAVDARPCGFTGDVDFGQLNAAHRVRIGGAGQYQFDRVCANGTVTLDGNLEVVLEDGYQPQPGDQFMLVVAEAVGGEFDHVALPQLAGRRFQVVQGPTSLMLEVVADATPVKVPVPIPAGIALAAGLLVIGRLALRSRHG